MRLLPQDLASRSVVKLLRIIFRSDLFIDVGLFVVSRMTALAMRAVAGAAAFAAFFLSDVVYYGEYYQRCGENCRDYTDYLFHKLTSFIIKPDPGRGRRTTMNPSSPSDPNGMRLKPGYGYKAKL